MVTQLTKRFQQISSEIELAINADDLKLVEELDKDIVQIWQNLLQHAVADASDTLILAEFLIDQLIGVGPISGTDQQIKRKLLALFVQPG
ncbi:MAG: hypothetical protein GY742_13040 [Hyphomicrobiales bacterium]|nr:hypothetical protein [Hyphomicrobiales bacterium]